MQKRFIFLLVMGLAVALAGCDKFFPKQTKPSAGTAVTALRVPMTVKGTVIAKVNNIAITLEDLNEEIAAFNTAVEEAKPEAKISTPEQKINYLKNEMVRRMLLYQEALTRGVDKNEEVQKVLEKTKRDLLVVELVREEARKIDASPKEIEEYYNTYKDQLREPEERQVREIMVLTEPEGKDVLIQLLQGGDFATLAKERSKAASSKEGGDLGFVKKGKKFPQFDEVAFADSLEAGKMSTVFKGPDGYYIVKLEAKRGGKQKQLSEMWDDIKKGLTFLKQQQRIESLITKLSQDSKIEVYEGQVK